MKKAATCSCVFNEFRLFSREALSLVCPNRELLPGKLLIRRNAIPRQQPVILASSVNGMSAVFTLAKASPTNCCPAIGLSLFMTSL
jgi:hypothetical protein